MILRLSEHTSTKYGAIYLITYGVFPYIRLTFSWVADNQMTSNKRGAGLALFSMIRQSDSFLGAHIFPDEDEPYFFYGMAIYAGVLFAGGALVLILSNLLRFEDYRRIR